MYRTQLFQCMRRMMIELSIGPSCHAREEDIQEQRENAEPGAQLSGVPLEPRVEKHTL
jgi:hypothetical protein